MAAISLGSINVEFTANTSQGIAGLRSATSALTNAANRAREATSRFGESISILQAGISGIALGGLIGQAREYDRALVSIRAVTKQTGAEFEVTRQRILALAKALAVPADEAARAFNEIVQAGFSASEAFDVLDASIRGSIAGQTSSAVASSALIQVLNAFKIAASDSENVMGKLVKAVDLGVFTFEKLATNIGQVAPIASTTGLSLDELLATLTSLTRSEANLDEVTTQVRALLSDLLAPSVQARAAIEGLLGSTITTAIETRGFAETLRALIDATQGSASELAKFFPNIRALAGVAKLAGGGIRELDKDIGVLSNTGARTLAETLAIVRASVDQLLQSIASTIRNSFFEWFERNRSAIVDATLALKQFVSENGQLIGQVIKVGAAIAAVTLAITAAKIAAVGLSFAFGLVANTVSAVSVIASGLNTVASAARAGATGTLALASAQKVAAVSGSTLAAQQVALAASSNAVAVAQGAVFASYSSGGVLASKLAAATSALGAANLQEKLAAYGVVDARRAEGLAKAQVVNANRALAASQARLTAAEAAASVAQARGIRNPAYGAAVAGAAVNTADRAAALAAAQQRLVAATNAVALAEAGSAFAQRQSTAAAVQAAAVKVTLASRVSALSAAVFSASGRADLLARSLNGLKAAGAATATVLGGLVGASGAAATALALLAAKIAAAAAAAVAFYKLGTLAGQSINRVGFEASQAADSLDEMDATARAVGESLSGIAKIGKVDEAARQLQEYKKTLEDLLDLIRRFSSGESGVKEEIDKTVSALNKLSAGGSAIKTFEAEYQKVLDALKSGAEVIAAKEVLAAGDKSTKAAIDLFNKSRFDPQPGELFFPTREAAALTVAQREKRVQTPDKLFGPPQKGPDGKPIDGTALLAPLGDLQKRTEFLSKFLIASGQSEENAKKMLQSFLETEAVLIGIRAAQAAVDAASADSISTQARLARASKSSLDYLVANKDAIPEAIAKITDAGASSSEKSIKKLSDSLREITDLRSTVETQINDLLSAERNAGKVTPDSSTAIGLLADVQERLAAAVKSAQDQIDAERIKQATEVSQKIEEQEIELLKARGDLYAADLRANALALAKKLVDIREFTAAGSQEQADAIKTAIAIRDEEDKQAARSQAERYKSTEEGKKLEAALDDQRRAAGQREQAEALAFEADLARKNGLLDRELEIRLQIVETLKDALDVQLLAEASEKATRLALEQSASLRRQTLDDLRRAGRDVTPALRDALRATSGGSDVGDRGAIRSRFASAQGPGEIKAIVDDARDISEQLYAELARAGEDARKRRDKDGQQGAASSQRDLIETFRIIQEEAVRRAGQIPNPASFVGPPSSLAPGAPGAAGASSSAVPPAGAPSPAVAPQGQPSTAPGGPGGDTPSVSIGKAAQSASSLAQSAQGLDSSVASLAQTVSDHLTSASELFQSIGARVKAIETNIAQTSAYYQRARTATAGNAIDRG